MNSPHRRHIAGCMTGTSMDGLDVALVQIEGRGLAMTASIVATHSEPLGSLADDLRDLAGGEGTPALGWMQAAHRLGMLHAEAIEGLMQRASAAGGATPPQLDAVAAHGQTVWHAPDQGLSGQLFDPWPVVRRWSVPVVYDLRGADLAAGGQGAPITPLADWVMFADASEHRTIVNLGGICNITHLPPPPPRDPQGPRIPPQTAQSQATLQAADINAGSETSRMDRAAPAATDVVRKRCDPTSVRGRDIGPCNLLLDGLIRRLRPGLRMDEGGTLATDGTVREPIVEAIHAHGYIAGGKTHSTGREQFDDQWLDSIAALAMDHGEMAEDAVADALASACAAVAQLIHRHLPETVDRIILAGGGAHNRALVRAIEQVGGTAVKNATIIRSDDLGVPASYREAAQMAVLGALCQDGVPITLERITGGHRPGVAGTWAGLSPPVWG